MKPEGCGGCKSAMTICEIESGPCPPCGAAMGSRPSAGTQSPLRRRLDPWILAGVVLFGCGLFLCEQFTVEGPVAPAAAQSILSLSQPFASLDILASNFGMSGKAFRALAVARYAEYARAHADSYLSFPAYVMRLQALLPRSPGDLDGAGFLLWCEPQL